MLVPFAGTVTKIYRDVVSTSEVSFLPKGEDRDATG